MENNVIKLQAVKSVSYSQRKRSCKKFEMANYCSKEEKYKKFVVFYARSQEP